MQSDELDEKCFLEGNVKDRTKRKKKRKKRKKERDKEWRTQKKKTTKPSVIETRLNKVYYIPLAQIRIRTEDVITMGSEVSELALYQWTLTRSVDVTGWSPLSECPKCHCRYILKHGRNKKDANSHDCSKVYPPLCLLTHLKIDNLYLEFLFALVQFWNKLKVDQVARLIWIVRAFWLVNKCVFIALWSTKMTWAISSTSLQVVRTYSFVKEIKLYKCAWNIIHYRGINF